MDSVQGGRSREASDPHGEVTGRDARTGTAYLARYRAAEEHYYKTPQVHEQEYRTALATLRVGERVVRDRFGVRRERVRMLRPPRPRHRFAARTREAIERVRGQPLYRPPASERPSDVSAAPPDAAARLRAVHEAHSG